MERLNDPAFVGGLNMEKFYDLCIEAGYSREVAERAAGDRGMERLRMGLET